MVINFADVAQSLRIRRDKLSLAIETLEAMEPAPAPTVAAEPAPWKHAPKSAATRRKMSRSQRKRWAAFKAA